MIGAREEYELSQDRVGQTPRERDSYHGSADSGVEPLVGRDDRQTYLTLFGCFVGLVAELGLWSTAGVIELYMAAHVLADESGMAILMVFVLFVSIRMFGSMLSGVVLDRYGGAAVCYAGSVLMTGGLMATASCTELYQFILAFSVTCGVGCSLLTPPFVKSIGYFFCKRRGMVLAIAIPEAFVCGVVWLQLCRSMYTSLGFTWTIRTLAFCIGALLFTASVCVPSRGDQTPLGPYAAE